VATVPLELLAAERYLAMLHSAMGEITSWLADPATVEVMLNPDGRLWIDRLREGVSYTGKRLDAEVAERIIRLAADHVSRVTHSKLPRLSAELLTGERFEGQLPPIVRAPAFNIRKRAVAIFTLEDYVGAGIMAAQQAEFLSETVRRADSNILVVGGTSTGKTTLVNALLAEVARTGDRVILIEDVFELQCAAPNLVSMRTVEGVASLSDLVRSSLRMRPDRIIVGEVRGGEALELVKAWGTGHAGGIGTIHAGSAVGALRRLEQLIQEVVVTVPRELIADTINVIAVLAGRGSARRLVELAAVEKNLSPGGQYGVAPAVNPNVNGDHS
jgi:type IV secretion system protein TrbB